jgi:putative DNA primase/helicase
MTRAEPFNPPLEERLNDDVVLLVRAARRAPRGLYANLQLWNECLLHADEIAVDQARDRRRFIRDALKQHPDLDTALLQQALLKVVAALPDKMARTATTTAASPISAPPEPSSEEDGSERLPWIDAAEGDLRIVTSEAWTAIQQANESSPQFFRHGGIPIRLELDDDGTLFPCTLTADRLRHVLARVANWYRDCRVKDGDGAGESVRVIVPPPKDVVRDVLATPEPRLPVLRRIVEAPVFAPDGTLQTTPGYHPRSRTYYAPRKGFSLPPVAEHPSFDDVRRARDLLLGEVFRDFSFVSKADRAHAAALSLQPFCRDFIDGPTPLHLIEAPCEGSGKGLLADVCLMPAMGRRYGALAPGRSEEEWRKSITAALREGHEALWIDNITQPLDSGTLAAALTAIIWEDRLLGLSKTIRVPVRCVWLATANNPVLSRELTRRSVRIRIDPRVDRPWLRQGFHHEDLRAWVQEHRADLVWAALTLVSAWLSAGRPHPDMKPLGSYEGWLQVIGGILRVAEIQGFLSNLQDFYAVANTEVAAMGAFVQKWWREFPEIPVIAKDLLPLAITFPGLGIEGMNALGQCQSLGKKLAALRDRVIGDYRIAYAGEHAGTQRWKLVRLGKSTEENPPNPLNPPGSPITPRENPAQETFENLMSSNDTGGFGGFSPADFDSESKSTPLLVDGKLWEAI